jgi:hypothetical protein
MELDSYLSEKQKKRRNRQRYMRAVIACGAVYLAVIGVAWLVFRSPLLLVKNITVEGANDVSSSSVTALLQSSILRDHNFWKSLLGIRNMLIYPNVLMARDVALIPQLASVTISKDYFAHTVTATVTERSPVGIWCFMAGSPLAAAGMNASGTVDSMAGENCYWFDDVGVLYDRTFDTEGSLMFAVHDYSQGKLGLGDAMLPAEFVPNLISILEVLKKSGVDVNEVALDDLELQEIDVTTFDGPTLYFSLRFPADPDLAVLQSLMAKPGFGKLQYVDFRVENRAFYK